MMDRMTAVATAVHLDTLWTAQLLCAICEEAPWTQPARWHTRVLLCAQCAEGEPDPDGEPASGNRDT
jgi:hypothetical protein